MLRVERCDVFAELGAAFDNAVGKKASIPLGGLGQRVVERPDGAPTELLLCFAAVEREPLRFGERSGRRVAPPQTGPVVVQYGEDIAHSTFIGAFRAEVPCCGKFESSYEQACAQLKIPIGALEDMLPGSRCG